MGCPFCQNLEREILFENKHFNIIFDKYPVTDLHVLILSKAHKQDFFSLDRSEQTALTEVVLRVKNFLLEKDESISGFNLGMNCGESAGQTVMHFHAHVIPRRNGDTDDPRGGVRGVIANKQKY